MRRIMYLRKVCEGKGAKKSNMEPVWITCDDLNTEGILVRCSSCTATTTARQQVLSAICATTPRHDRFCDARSGSHLTLTLSSGDVQMRLASGWAACVGTLLGYGTRLSCQ